MIQKACAQLPDDSLKIHCIQLWKKDLISNNPSNTAVIQNTVNYTKELFRDFFVNEKIYKVGVDHGGWLVDD